MVSKADKNKRIVERFWAAINANDFRTASEFLHDEFVLEWPQSGECICGRANFIAVNENYPSTGRWSATVHRLLADADEVASEVTVTDGAVTATAITFSKIHNGKIVRQTEYWPDPFEAAAWRAKWVKRM